MYTRADSKTSYQDIINLPHHVSASRPHMPLSERAAQFSPFAALAGYREAIREAGRITSEKKELDENAKSILNGKLQFLLETADEYPVVQITCFQQDLKKGGGSYEKFTGCIKKADPCRRMIIMQNGREISVDDIADIQGDIFDSGCCPH